MKCNYKQRITDPSKNGSDYIETREELLQQKVIQDILDDFTDIAKDAGMKEVQRQSADIVNRARNKLYLAMLEAGLSPKTVERVQRIADEKIEPWYQQYMYNLDEPEAGPGVADFALQQKLEERGVKYIPVKEEM